MSTDDEKSNLSHRAEQYQWRDYPADPSDRLAAALHDAVVDVIDADDSHSLCLDNDNDRVLLKLMLTNKMVEVEVEL